MGDKLGNVTIVAKFHWRYYKLSILRIVNIGSVLQVECESWQWYICKFLSCALLMLGDTNACSVDKIYFCKKVGRATFSAKPHDASLQGSHSLTIGSFPLNRVVINQNCIILIYIHSFRSHIVGGKYTYYLIECVWY